MQTPMHVAIETLDIYDNPKSERLCDHKGLRMPHWGR